MECSVLGVFFIKKLTNTKLSKQSKECKMLRYTLRAWDDHKIAIRIADAIMTVKKVKLIRILGRCIHCISCSMIVLACRLYFFSCLQIQCKTKINRRSSPRSDRG